MATRKNRGWKESSLYLVSLFILGACSPADEGEADWEQIVADLKSDLVVGMVKSEIEQVLRARKLEWSRSEDRLDWDSDHDPTVGPLIARYYAIEREAGGSFVVDRDIMIKIDVGPERKAVRVLVEPVYTGP